MLLRPQMEIFSLSYRWGSWAGEGRSSWSKIWQPNRGRQAGSLHVCWLHLSWKTLSNSPSFGRFLHVETAFSTFNYPLTWLLFGCLTEATSGREDLLWSLGLRRFWPMTEQKARWWRSSVCVGQTVRWRHMLTRKQKVGAEVLGFIP